MKLFFYCKRQLQMYMTYTWSQITITSWVFCVLHACYTLFLDIRNLQIHHLWSILKQFLKDFKNNTQLLRNFLRQQSPLRFRLCITWETIVYRRILTMCRQNCIPYAVGVFSFLSQSICPTWET